MYNGCMVLTSDERMELYAPYLEIMRDCRIQAALPQTDLAAATNLSAKYVTLIESGKRVPAIETMLALMAKTGVLRSTADGMLQELMALFEWKE